MEGKALVAFLYNVVMKLMLKNGPVYSNTVRRQLVAKNERAFSLVLQMAHFALQKGG